MTCVRDIVDEEHLEREFDSIRHVFKDLNKDERPLRIEWGTREAMWEPTYIVTNFPPSHKFHDDQISGREVVVDGFPYMDMFRDFRLFNGLTIKEFDDFLVRLVPLFYALEKMHAEKKMGGVGSEEKADISMIGFERATEIATNFLREYGHPHPKLDTTIPSKGWWDFLFDVGAVSKKILIVRVNKEGKITTLEPMEPSARREISKEDHIRKHDELHKALDELTGDYIRITGKLPGATNILELMEWSNRQRANPETKGDKVCSKEK